MYTRDVCAFTYIIIPGCFNTAKLKRGTLYVSLSREEGKWRQLCKTCLQQQVEEFNFQVIIKAVKYISDLIVHINVHTDASHQPKSFVQGIQRKYN